MAQIMNADALHASSLERRVVAQAQLVRVDVTATRAAEDKIRV